MAALTARYLVDKSALARMPLAPVRERLAPILEAGEAATCPSIDLEVLYSARSRKDYETLRERRSLAYHQIPTSEADLQRAIEVQGLLAVIGHHRVPIPDSLIAATAERAGLTVLHSDADFDRIATVTGQSTEWVAPRGSL